MAIQGFKNMRLAAFLVTAALALAACTTTEPTLGPDGKPLPRVYRIAPSDNGKIQFRMLDSVNSLRRAAGLARIEMDARLTAAAATHARDMAVQNRPWHFGSDGSSPIDRVQRVGYDGRLLGENISETYETELETLAAWMEDPTTRRIIVDPDAAKLGFAWHQEANGKIWWTLITGT
ncbi:MAG: CAP domain-containing protein [Lutimaribacter sp.]